MVNNLKWRGICLNIRAFFSLDQWPEDDADFSDIQQYDMNHSLHIYKNCKMLK